ncbi:hypothetical protein KSP40_PGU000345 [Platanthera guangdongensis]|uniref:Uncharacterized protein n=1 Tax=Platanthera guangdongensis TaxID=2320717 RepID=A0ABR2MH45_9ASPA
MVISLVAVDAYQLICLSHLESDHINPYDFSSRVNVVIVPEFIAQGILISSYKSKLAWSESSFLG